MARKRKTAGKRRQEQEATSYIAWEGFSRKLGSLQTWSDAVKFVGRSISNDDPERTFHSNFRAFFNGFVIPFGVTARELVLYAQFVERLSNEDFAAPTSRGEVLEKLKTAIEAKEPK